MVLNIRYRLFCVSFVRLGEAVLALALTLSAAKGGDVRIGELTYTVLRKPRRLTHDYALSLKPSPSFERLDLVFWMTSPADFARLRWDGQGYHLFQTRNGEAEELAADAVPLPVKELVGGTLLLRNRAHWFEVIVSGRRVFRVMGVEGAKGRIACAVGDGFPEVRDVSYQSVEDLAFGDDFMRTEEETSSFGLWEPAGGEWRLHSVMEEIRANPDARIREGREPLAERSSNPFSLSGKAEKEALILTGHPFWADYTVGVSAKPMKGTFGLAFGVTDKATLWLVRWRLPSLGVRPGQLELIRREGGRDERVAHVWVDGRNENWYRLEVRTQGDLIEVLVDRAVVLQCRDARSIGGRIGLYVAAGETFFDDVSAETWPEIRFDRASSLAGHGQALQGEWHVSERDGTLSLDTGETGTGIFGGSQLYALGGANWEAGCLRAKISVTQQQKRIGLCFGLKNAENYWRVGWSGKSGGLLSLQRVAEGKVSKVVGFPASVPRPEQGEHELLLDLRTEGQVLAFVDGTLGLRGRIEEEVVGRFGLFAEGKGGVRFSGVDAYVEPMRDWEHPVNVDIFLDDPFMQGWASPRWAWIEQKHSDGSSFAPKRYIHKGDFYGAFRISAPISDGVTLRFGDDQVDWEGGWALAFSVDPAKGMGTAEVRRPGKAPHRKRFKLQTKSILPGKQIVDEKIGALPRTPDTISYGTFTLNRDGHLLWVTVGDNELVTLYSKVPLRGRAVGLEVGEPLDHVHVSVQRSQVRDYLFEKAPVDWLKVGQWEVTNRFACDPRWSHMNGRSKGLAALWNKFAYEGDYTLECYAGMRMRQGDLHEGGVRNYYPRIGDINFAFAGQSRALFSGYNAILAAWDPMWSEKWTQFWRQGELFERTDREFIPRGREKRPTARAIEVEWDPGGRPVHGAWYYIKARKTGGRFDVSFDNVPVFTVTDPEPLPAQWLALWTQHNSIVVARVKIGYDSIRIPDRQKAALAAPEWARLPVADEARPGLVLSSHPGRFFDFEDGVQGWEPVSGDQSAEVTVRAAGSEGGAGNVLELRNLHTGGDFGVRIPVKGIDLDRVKSIQMDVAVSAEAKVNLYVSFEDEPFEMVFVALSGPDHEGPNLISLGKFAGVAADGNWHHVRFDLGKVLRQRFPWRDRFAVKEMVLGMLHEGYANAGLGGNPEKAVFRVDNVVFTGVGADTARVDSSTVAEDTPSYRLVALREVSSHAADLSGEATDGLLKLDGPGLWYVCSVTQNGEVASTSRPVPVWVAPPLRVLSTVPAADSPWGGESVRIRFGKETAAELVPAALSFTVSGESISLDSTNADYDPIIRELTFDASPLVAGTEDGKELEFVLRYCDTVTRGQPVAAEGEDGGEGGQSGEPGGVPLQAFRWRAKVSRAEDRYPPSRVSLSRDDYTRIDFDSGFDGVSLFSDQSHVKIERVPRGDDPADRALRILNRICGSDFGVRLFERDFPAGAYPLLVFDYRTGEHARADFQVRRRGKPLGIGFTDCEENEQMLGSIPGIQGDDAWHTARVDFAGLMDASASKAFSTKFTAQGLALGDWGYAAVPPGVSFEVDNINLVPAVSTREPLKLAWAATDLSGIKGYSYAWHAAPDYDVDRVLDGTEGNARFETLPNGEVFFHIRALDGAGNWGEASHYMFLVDNDPPQVAAVTPADGSRSASSVISIQFAKGVTRVDPSTVKLRLNGKKCSLSAYTTKWDGAERTLSWDVLNAWRVTREPIPDGKGMAFRVEGVRDFAGNALDSYEWTWHVDHSQDKTGPAPPRLWSYTHDFRYYDHFTEAAGYWRPYSRKNSAEVSTTIDPETGDSCLRISRIDKGRRFSVYRYRGNLGLSDYPLMAFDCKIMPGAHIDLLLYVEKKWRPIRMTGLAEGDEIGRIEEAKDDGKWRHITVDIEAIIRKQFEDAEELPDVRMVGFGNVSGKANGTMTGPYMFIDNFAFLGPASPVPLLGCMAADITGVQHFEISFDRNSRGTPSAEMSAIARQYPIAAVDGTGVWFIHARALDGAGNWGAMAHYPYYCTNPVTETSNNGLEAEGRWKVIAGRKRSRCALHEVDSAGGGNRLLVAELYMSAGREVRLGTALDTPLAADADVTVSADFYHHADDPIKVVAYLSPRYGDGVVRSESVAVEPKTWRRDVQFRFSQARVRQAAGAKGTGIERIGFVLSPKAKVRDTFLIDTVRLVKGGTAVTPAN